MIKIIKEREPVTIKEYFIEFKYKDDPDAGFCFPAFSNGDPDLDHMTSEALANYESCFKDDRLEGPEFTKNEFTYMEPAVGKCICGSLVTLDSDYQGAVRCECGRWYNLFGQSLKDPKYWEEDEYYSDMPEEED